MWLVIEDHDNLFVMAEVVHFLGIGLLAYKLTKKKNAGGPLQQPCMLVICPRHCRVNIGISAAKWHRLEAACSRWDAAQDSRSGHRS